MTLQDAKDRLLDLVADHDREGNIASTRGAVCAENTPERRALLSEARTHWANADAIRVVLAELDRGGK